jgi:hypothetical protein
MQRLGKAGRRYGRVAGRLQGPVQKIESGFAGRPIAINRGKLRCSGGRLARLIIFGFDARIERLDGLLGLGVGH